MRRVATQTAAGCRSRQRGRSADAHLTTFVNISDLSNLKLDPLLPSTCSATPTPKPKAEPPAAVRSGAIGRSGMCIHHGDLADDVTLRPALASMAAYAR